MVFDVLRGYLHVASGLSDVTKQRARDLAEMIVVQGMDVTSKSQEQVQTLTDELVESSRTNRELLIGLIRTEVDRTVSRMGFVREDELAAVREHVHRLEAQLQKEHQRAAGKATEVVMGTAGSSTSAARSAVGAASKTVSGVAGVMATGAAKMAGTASSAAKPAGDSAGGSSFDEADALFGKRSTPKTTSGESQVKGTPKARTQSKKAAPKTAPAKKGTAKKASSKKSAPKKEASTKTAPKKATVKKAATKKKAAPKKKESPKKATASRASEVKTPKKEASQKPQPTKKGTASVDTRASAANETPPAKESRGTGAKGNS